jgi:hypothetical protein
MQGIHFDCTYIRGFYCISDSSPAMKTLIRRSLSKRGNIISLKVFQVTFPFGLGMNFKLSPSKERRLLCGCNLVVRSWNAIVVWHPKYSHVGIVANNIEALWRVDLV